MWAPWAALVGVALTSVVALTAGARAASAVLAGVLATAGTIRALDPAGGPEGGAIRSRMFDVALMLTLGAAIAILGLTSSGV